MEEGFDSRLAKNVGHGFGLGSYFAQAASYSQGFTPGFPVNGISKMFVARVAIGSSTPGTPAMKRPPKKTNGDFYNSTSGSHHGSNQWCVFDHYQAYPQYIIEYQ